MPLRDGMKTSAMTYTAITRGFPKSNSATRKRGSALLLEMLAHGLFWGLIALCWAPPASQAQFSFPVQPLRRIVCVYSAVPTQVRSENLAARLGDARLDCTNDGVYNPVAPGLNNIQQYVLAQITVSLNTAVTTILAGNVTSSVLTINANDSSFAGADSVFPAAETCGIEGTPPTSMPDPRYPCPQKGRIVGPNAYQWAGVQFPVPGAPNDLGTLPTDDDSDGVPDCVDIFDQTSTDSCFNTVTTVRITNLFGNAPAVGAGGAIFANLTIFSFVGISITPSNQQTVANVFQGLGSDFDVAGQFQCVSGMRTLNATFEEKFAGSFKVLGEPTVAQGDFSGENGYPLLEMSAGNPPQSVGGTGGGATQATRFMLRLRDIPDGVVPSVPNTVDEDATGVEGCPTDPGSPDFEDLCLQIVEGADANGAGGATGDGVGDYEIPVADEDGQVIYEVKNGDPARMQDVVIPVDFTCMAGSPTTDLSALTTFAPLSQDGEANSIGPIPRFIDTGGDPFPTAPVDLELSKVRTSYYLAVPGVDQVVYEFFVSNHGNSEATGVELVDMLPNGLTHVSDDMGCGVANNIVTCPVGTVAAGATVVRHITASVDVDADGTLVNSAAVSSDTPEPVPDSNSNMDSASVWIPADLVITSLTAPTTGAAGETIDVSVNVANQSNRAADPFRLGFYYSADSTIETSDPASSLTCVFPSGLADTTNCTGPVDIPLGLPPGAYFFGAIVDITQMVTEKSETNNTRVSDNGPLNILAGACPADLTVSDQTLNGVRIIGATNSVVLGSNLVVDGESISVDAPNVSILSGTSISGAFSVGNNAACP